MPDVLTLATAEERPGIDTALWADAQWSKVRGLNRNVELLKA